jgi:hypothetical protein
MTNYDEITTQASAHRTSLLKNAEQQRLVHSLATAQPHPIMAWVGRQLIHWGKQLQGETILPALPLVQQQ